jgi:DNA-directed RNA polymerase specialized sigma subunit
MMKMENPCLPLQKKQRNKHTMRQKKFRISYPGRQTLFWNWDKTESQSGNPQPRIRMRKPSITPRTHTLHTNTASQHQRNKPWANIQKKPDGEHQLHFKYPKRTLGNPALMSSKSFGVIMTDDEQYRLLCIYRYGTPQEQMQAATQLFNAILPYIKRMATRYRGHGIFEELISKGKEIFMKCLKSWNNERGTLLTNFLARYIAPEFRKQYLRSLNIPLSIISAPNSFLQKVANTANQMRKGHSIDSIVLNKNFQKTTRQRLIEHSTTAKIIRLDQQMPDDGPQLIGNDSVSRDVDANETLELIKQYAKKHLSKREQAILQNEINNKFSTREINLFPNGSVEIPTSHTDSITLDVKDINSKDLHLHLGIGEERMRQIKHKLTTQLYQALNPPEQKNNSLPNPEPNPPRQNQYDFTLRNQKMEFIPLKLETDNPDKTLLLTITITATNGDQNVNSTKTLRKRTSGTQLEFNLAQALPFFIKDKLHWMAELLHASIKIEFSDSSDQTVKSITLPPNATFNPQPCTSS